ncbi:hypothetical protein M3C58_03110 [Brachybacterium muris]|uniref:hypothetical protein n=1 Tax=Brachybacterium muris TaxID=219301 RepID=UPI0021A2ED0F|nr:hypothetical protein [Brachybacterium muris]MCT1997198.1 hypothetical protein [Brachybacterium muris]
MTQPTNDGRTGPLPPAGLQHADADRVLREDTDRRDPDARDADGDRDLLGREDDRLDGRTSAERDEAERYGQDRETSPRADHGDPDRGVDRDATIDPDYDVEDDPNVISLAEQDGEGKDGTSASRQRQAEERLAEGYDADRDHDGDRDLDRDRDRRDDDGLLDDNRGGAHRADGPAREGDLDREDGLLDRDRDGYGDEGPARRGNPGPAEGLLDRDGDARRDDGLGRDGDLLRKDPRRDDGLMDGDHRGEALR